LRPRHSKVVRVEIQSWIDFPPAESSHSIESYNPGLYKISQQRVYPC
jgi:hypothetical protein